MNRYEVSFKDIDAASPLARRLEAAAIIDVRPEMARLMLKDVHRLETPTRPLYPIDYLQAFKRTVKPDYHASARWLKESNAEFAETDMADQAIEQAEYDFNRAKADFLSRPPHAGEGITPLEAGILFDIQSATAMDWARRQDQEAYDELRQKYGHAVIGHAALDSMVEWHYPAAYDGQE